MSTAIIANSAEKKKTCGCPKKSKKSLESKDHIEASMLQTFDRIQWLKKHVLPQNLANRTVKLKYTKHISEMNEYFATKRVFKRFDDDGNSKF